MRLKKGKGFTLVELLIVVGLIGILMGAVVAVLNPAKFFADSRDARRKSDLGVIQAALEMYYAQNSAYPTGAPPFGGAWDPYLRQVPQEPQAGRSYCYQESAGDYLLCALMEGSDYTGSYPCTPAGGGPTPTPGGPTPTVAPTPAPSTYNYCLENPY